MPLSVVERWHGQSPRGVWRQAFLPSSLPNWGVPRRAGALHAKRRASPARLVSRMVSAAPMGNGPTLKYYCRGAADLLTGLGHDFSQWDTRRIRAFVFDRAKRSGASTTQHLITAIRAFLRFLIFHGLCPIHLDKA